MKKGNKSLTGKFSGKSEECGKHRHKKADFWEDEVNAHRRLLEWVSMKGERAGMAIDYYEVLVAHVEVETMTAQVDGGIAKK